LYDCKNVSHQAENTGWKCLKTGFWEKYFDVRQEAGENYIMKSFIDFTLRQHYEDGTDRIQGMRTFRSKMWTVEPVGSLVFRYEYNIKIDLKEIGWEVMEQGPAAGFCEHCNKRLDYIKKMIFFRSWATINFWGKLCTMELVNGTCKAVIDDFAEK
jgi:hypothetical protein